MSFPFAKVLLSGFMMACIQLFASLPAQQNLLRFEHINPWQDEYEGLVFGLQDHFGYLWLSTVNGLVRHDGRSARVWANDPDDPWSLPGNDVTHIAEISDSLMWVGTKYTGLSRFNRRNSRFTTFTNDPQDPGSLASDAVQTIVRGPQQSWWIGSLKGVQMAEKGTELGAAKFLQFPLVAAGEKVSFVSHIHWDAQGNGWFATGDGLRLVEAATIREFMQAPGQAPAGSRQFLAGERIYSLLIEPQKGVWISGWRGCWYWPWAAFERRDASEIARVDATSGGPSTARKILLDRQGNLWFASNGQGLYRLSAAARASADLSQMEFERYDNHPEDPGSFVGGITNYLVEDHSGNIWALAKLGLDMLNPRQTQFGHGKPYPEEGGYAKGNDIYSVCPDTQGDFWLGTQDGLIRMSADGRRLGHWYPAGASISTPYKNAVRCILRLDTQTLLVSTLDGIWQFDQASGRFSPVPGLTDTRAVRLTQRIFKILRDPDGSLWLGGRNGIVHFYPDRGILHHFAHDKNVPGSLSRDFVRNLHLDARQNLWVATENGLDLLPAARRQDSAATFEHFRHQADDPQSISNNQIRAIVHDHTGALWVGTDGGGVNRLDPATGKCIRYLKKDGLCNNTVYGLLTEKNGPRIWASTGNGLSVLDPETETIQRYDLKDGLQHNEFNVRACARSPEGALIFAGINGYNRFFPQHIQANPQPPAVVINGFRLSNQLVDFRTSPALSVPVEFAEEIRLQHSDNIFSFEFAALDFTNPAKNQYAYRLRGFSDEWVVCGNENKATFTNLAAGSYTFEVKASNNDGAWNTTPTSLRLVIEPAIWATWWAKLIYVLLGSGLLWFAWRVWRNRMRMQEKLRQEKLHAERSQELERIKSRFFAGISHEFRTPLSLIVGPLEKMRQEIQSEIGKRNIDMIGRNAQRLLRLVNQLLVVAGLEEGEIRLHPTEQDLNIFLRQIVETFRPGAEEKQVELDFRETENPALLCFDAENFEHIFYNLLANALKFTPAGGRISLRLAAEAGHYRVTVADTGIGVSPELQKHLFERFYQVPGEQAQGGTGLGLALVKELTELHQGTVSVQSQTGAGTTFSLIFPLENGLTAEQGLTARPAESPMAATPASQPAAQEIDAEKPIILIVEDNADLRAFIRSELEGEFSVLDAKEGAAGLALAQAQVPDLIISDVMMPVMDGIAMSRALKADQATSHIPIILLTARAAETSRIEGLEAGVDDYLTKPFSATELRLRIRNRFAYQQALAQRFRELQPETAEMPAPAKRENQFLLGVQAALEAALDNSSYSVEDLAAAVHLSRKQLYRKVKALTEKTPSQYMRTYRLTKGKAMLMDADLNVSEVAYAVGFSSPSYFSRCFQEEFGFSPSEVREGN